MFKRFLLLVVSIPTLLGFTSKVVACKWDLNPEVLLITSYENGEQQSSLDRLVYNKLKEFYGNKSISTIFNKGDDNTYAYVLANLITIFDLKKVFILDPSFIYYLPSNSSETFETSNLIRVLVEFTNVDFYFFNNQIANNIKNITNNIYEFCFDEPNKKEPTPILNYGAKIADHFIDQLTTKTGEIDGNKYNFETNENGEWVIKIGLINRIGNDYQQKVIDEFVTALNQNIPKSTVWDFKTITFDKFNVNYSFDNIQRVQAAALRLYQNDRVNFFLNTNNWFNNAIAYAASHTAQLPEYTKTIKFIADNVFDKDDYKYQDVNYMLFSYHVDINILEYTLENNIPEEYQVLDSASENVRAFGLNSNLNFVDGL